MPHQMGKIGTRFFEDGSLETPGIPKNASGSVGIPLKRDASDTRR